MMRRLLAAIDDSPAALAAADTSIALASTFGAELRFVDVADSGSDAVLGHVLASAAAAGIAAEAIVTDGGHPFEPYVGTQTEHLLEFTHVPVLVVPEDAG